MSRLTHPCVDIRGLLRNTRYPSGFRGLVKDDAGKWLPPDAAREWLLDELAKGRKVLPTGDCEGFSYETGCPSHRVEDSPEPEARP